MNKTEFRKSLTLILEESDKGLLLATSENVDKSTLSGYKTVVLDLNTETQRDLMYLECSRVGIDLSAIHSLNLSHCNLNYFPDAFADLQLKQLNLSHNKLEYVPDCIQNGLRFLEILDISYNDLQIFETEPKCVIKLRVLRINNNKLSNIPKWILEVNCFNLEELYYNYNYITTLKQSRFRHIHSYRLRKLELKNCVLRSEDIKFLKDIRTLSVLDLSNDSQNCRNCFVSCESFSSLFENVLWDDRLKILRLNDLDMSYLPDGIGKLLVLEELYLANNDLFWVPNTLTSLQKLRILDLSYNKVASLPKDIGNLNNLEVLKLSHNCISSAADFSTIINLRILDLYNNYFDNGCDIKISCNISQVDLEQNFFNTADLNIEAYEEKRDALRLDVREFRAVGPKEQHYDENTDDTDDHKTDSDWENDCERAVEVDYKVDSGEEESWSSKRESCDNGCTSSDNEWTGSEKKYSRSRKIKRVLQTYPDWAFEDDL